MAKIHLDRIKRKYGWSGESYKDLMSKIARDHLAEDPKYYSKPTEAGL